jgi:hypothetical protein
MSSRRKAVEVVHEEINFITSCIHFSSIAHEKFGAGIGKEAADELKVVLAVHQTWGDSLVRDVQVVLDKYNAKAGLKHGVNEKEITTCVLQADGRPYVCSVTHYVTVFLDAFIQNNTVDMGLIPDIVNACFPDNHVCIGRSFLFRIALVTLRLKSIIVPYVDDHLDSFRSAYNTFFRAYNNDLELDATNTSLGVVAELFPQCVVVLDK